MVTPYRVGRVTMSLGVSEYTPGESLAEWIERTDRALYQAKTEGRNRTCLAPTPEHLLADSAQERSLLEVIWEDTYASGHALIDAQHQKLFRLASALMAVLTENRPLSEVSLRLETLLAHTAQHFHDEELLLREARYHDLTEHAAVHASLMTRAWKLQADVQAGQLDFGKLVSRGMPLPAILKTTAAVDKKLDEAARTLSGSGHTEVVRQRGAGWYPGNDVELAWAADLIDAMRRVARRSAHASLDRALDEAVRAELRRYQEHDRKQQK